MDMTVCQKTHDLNKIGTVVDSICRMSAMPCFNPIILNEGTCNDVKDGTCPKQEFVIVYNKIVQRLIVNV